MQQQGDPPQPTRSDLAVFIQSLVNEGRAVVASHPIRPDDADALPLLQQLDALAREELAQELPTFSPNAALWAARLFYQLCRFVVCRDIPEEEIRTICSIPCPEPRGPETDWSADLTLRHLPNLLKLARHLSNADPLVAEMKQIARSWPLSSVGIEGLDDLQIDSLVEHTGLRRLYADRIIAATDKSRLGDARLDDLLRADLGIHRELAPTIAAQLFGNHA